MKKLVVLFTVLAALVLGQTNLFAQDSTAASSKDKKTEVSTEKKDVNTKTGKRGHKGKKHHKKNTQQQEGTPNQ